MNWLQFLSALGIGAILIKLLDIVWLQRVVQEHEQRTWLRDKRHEAFSNLSKELISLGLHRKKLSNAFEQFAVATEAMILMEDDSLIDRIDQFIVKLDKFNRLVDDKSSENEGKTEILYQELTKEARLIVKELRDILVKEKENRYLNLSDFLHWPLGKKS